LFKPEEAWEIIKRNAEKAKTAKTIWHSPKRGAKYTLVNVLDDRIIIWREDRNTEAILTKATVEQKALEMIFSGGKVKIGRLVSPTVTEETAFVFFHHQLGWSEDGEFIEVKNI